MFLQNLLLIAAMFLGLSLAKPLARQETNPLLTAGFVEGDMVLNTTSRNGLRDPAFRWPNKIVYYKFSAYYDDTHKKYVLNAMRNIESVSCVRFKEATGNTHNFVFITNYQNGCYASVGYLNQGPQELNLGRGCFYLGPITHELLHSLGFYHMQNNHNRDKYVRIVTENVMPNQLHNFEKYSEYSLDNYGEQYDYYSIMHYPANAFSINGKLNIIPLQAGVINYMGKGSYMSKSDIKKLNAMYRCYT